MNPSAQVSAARPPSAASYRVGRSTTCSRSIHFLGSRGYTFLCFTVNIRTRHLFKKFYRRSKKRLRIRRCSLPQNVQQWELSHQCSPPVFTSVWIAGRLSPINFFRGYLRSERGARSDRLRGEAARQVLHRCSPGDWPL
jgi:hypothetical protein